MIIILRIYLLIKLHEKTNQKYIFCTLPHKKELIVHSKHYESRTIGMIYKI